MVLGPHFRISTARENPGSSGPVFGSSECACEFGARILDRPSLSAMTPSSPRRFRRDTSKRPQEFPEKLENDSEICSDASGYCVVITVRNQQTSRDEGWFAYCASTPVSSNMDLLMH